MMSMNEGTLDRALRLVAGLALVFSAIAGVLGPWAYIGVIPLVTGTVGWCPLYTVLGINSCRRR